MTVLCIITSKGSFYNFHGFVPFPLTPPCSLPHSTFLYTLSAIWGCHGCRHQTPVVLSTFRLLLDAFIDNPPSVRWPPIRSLIDVSVPYFLPLLVLHEFVFYLQPTRLALETASYFRLLLSFLISFFPYVFLSSISPTSPLQV